MSVLRSWLLAHDKIEDQGYLFLSNVVRLLSFSPTSSLCVNLLFCAIGSQRCTPSLCCLHLVITTFTFCSSTRELVGLTTAVLSVTRLQLKLWLLQEEA
uniref:Uncharacterized protein n=1 Tax=Aegilops tauschii subsp. strangulata TaxID=200361 RepID=A0A453C9V6_AEGTS